MYQSVPYSQEYDLKQIQSIRVDCRVAHIKVTNYSGSSIWVSWHNTQYREMKISVTNGTLHIIEEDSVAFYELFGFLEMVNGSDFLKELTIEIPYEFSGSKIVLNTQVNGIAVYNFSFDGALEIATKVREVYLENIKAGHIYIRTDNGQITARNIAVQDAIRLYTMTGNVLCEIADNPDDYAIQCFSQVGRCSAPHCGGHGAKSVEASTNTGNVAIHFAPYAA